MRRFVYGDSQRPLFRVTPLRALAPRNRVLGLPAPFDQAGLGSAIRRALGPFPGALGRRGTEEQWLEGSGGKVRTFCPG
jgi:hypothetical protein